MVLVLGCCGLVAGCDVSEINFGSGSSAPATETRVIQAPCASGGGHAARLTLEQERTALDLSKTFKAELGLSNDRADNIYQALRWLGAQSNANLRRYAGDFKALKNHQAEDLLRAERMIKDAMRTHHKQLYMKKRDHYLGLIRKMQE